MNTETGFSGPLNLGNPREFTMLELAELIITQVGGKSKLAYRPLPQDDPQQRQPDIGLARDKLHWEPKVPLEDGLRETISYFRAMLDS
jgi:UDP-glucuronate decarboxylase